MRRLHPILIVIGFRLRANAPEGQKRFPISFLTFALAQGSCCFLQSQSRVCGNRTSGADRSDHPRSASSEWLHGSGRRRPARQWSYPGFPVGFRAEQIGSIWGMDRRQNNSSSRHRAVPRRCPSKGSRVAITARIRH